MATFETIRNGYIFTTDTETGTTTARGVIQNESAPRSRSLQSNAGGALRQSADQGGHLVAASENGAAVKENHFAQDGTLNMCSMRRVENTERKLTADAVRPAQVETERIAYSSGMVNGNVRPDAFMINDTVKFEDGTETKVNLSFQNMTPEEQAQMCSIVESIEPESFANPGDGLREQMSNEEYVALISETEAFLPDSADEFYSYPSQPSNGAEIESGVGLE